MRMREHLETRVHIGEGGPCPLSIRCLFRHGKQTCGYHAIKSSRSMLKRCSASLRTLDGRFFSFLLSFYPFIFRPGCERNKEEVNFPFILSRIPFSFFCARVDASLLLLAKRNGEIFPREMQFKLDFGKFTK